MDFDNIEFLVILPKSVDIVSILVIIDQAIEVMLGEHCLRTISNLLNNILCILGHCKRERIARFLILIA